MQISKKSVLDQVEFHVRGYARTYRNVGDVFYEYMAASACVHSLSLLFSDNKSIVAACEDASRRIDNIFLNGDECDDTRRHSSPSEPVSLSVDSSSEFEIDTPVESEPSKNIANHFRVFDADDNHIYTHVTFVSSVDLSVNDSTRVSEAA